MISQDHTPSEAILHWQALVRFVNGSLGGDGIRDPENLCVEFDGRGYNGMGQCHSDGHYLCTDCSHLSPNAPRFTWDLDGRADRLRLFWRRK
jgi:hypothetical protein